MHAVLDDVLTEEELEELNAEINSDDVPPAIFIWNDTNLAAFVAAIPRIAGSAPFSIPSVDLLTINWLKGAILNYLSTLVPGLWT